MVWSNVWASGIASDEWQSRVYYFLSNWQLLNAASITNVLRLMNGALYSSNEWFMKAILLLIILLLLRKLINCKCTVLPYIYIYLALFQKSKFSCAPKPNAIMASNKDFRSLTLGLGHEKFSI